MASCAALRQAIGKVTIEPVMFLIFVAIGGHAIIIQDLVIDRVCRVNLNYSSAICSDLNHHTDIQEEVQRLVSLLQMIMNVLVCLPGIPVCLVAGPWSDRNGRRMLIVLPVVGMLVSQIINLCFTYFSHLRAEFLLLSAVQGLFGGFGCVIIGMFGYVTDITTKETRTARIGFLDLTLSAGFTVGTLCSGKVYKYLGFYGVFGICASIFLGCIILVFILMKENTNNSVQSEDSTMERQDCMNYIRSVFKVCFKKRPQNKRRIILVMIATMVLNVTAYFSGNILYLYTRLKFGWTEQHFTVWSAVNTTASVFGIVCILPILSSRLKMHDGLIGIIAAFSGVAFNTMLALVTMPWMMYLCSGLGTLSTVGSVVIRSILSKIGPVSEVGRLFSLVSCFEAMMPVLTVPVLTVMYNRTLDTFPGAVFLLQAAVFALMLANMVYVYRAMRRDGFVYGVLAEEDVEEDEDEDAGEEESEEASLTEPIMGEETSVEESPTCLGRAGRLAKLITVEPFMFLATFAMGLNTVITQNLFIDRVCLVNLNYTSSVCSDLSSYKSLQATVQKEVSVLLLLSQIISALPSIPLAFLAGPWSDTHGRKPLVIVPLVGAFLSQVISIALTYFSRLRAEYLLLASMQGLFGGMTCMIIGFFSYIVDVSTQETRTARLGLIELAISSGNALGMLASGKVFKYFGYYAVFGACASVHLVNFILLAIFMREPSKTNHINSSESTDANTLENNSSQVRICSLDHVTSVVTTCFKRRPQKRRAIILLMIASIAIYATVFFTSGIQYLYTRLKFGWTEQDFTVWSSLNTLGMAAGVTLILPLLTVKLKIADGLIGICAGLSGMAANILYAFVPVAWMMYIGPFISVLSLLTSGLIRSILSKVAPETEIGKIYTMVTCLEALMPLASGPLATLLYNETIDIFPGYVFLLMAGIFAGITFSMLFVYHQMTRADFASEVPETRGR